MPGLIQIKGPNPPPNPLLYPAGRKTASHTYRVYDGAGGLLHSGSGGPDRDEVTAHALTLAAGRGLTDPAIEYAAP